jgi:hypothetical protein
MNMSESERSSIPLRHKLDKSFLRPLKAPPYMIYCSSEVLKKTGIIIHFQVRTLHKRTCTFFILICHFLSLNYSPSSVFLFKCRLKN